MAKSPFYLPEAPILPTNFSSRWSRSDLMQGDFARRRLAWARLLLLDQTVAEPILFQSALSKGCTQSWISVFSEASDRRSFRNRHMDKGSGNTAFRCGLIIRPSYSYSPSHNATATIGVWNLVKNHICFCFRDLSQDNRIFRAENSSRCSSHQLLSLLVF